MFEKVLSCQNLPTLPTIAMQLLEKTRDPDVSMREIARLVESDLGLASRILRTVNSSFYGLSKPCPSIERALNYLGLKAVKSLVLGFSMVNVGRCVKDGAGFDMVQYWRRTILSATGARTFALAGNTCDADEAFTAGLFQDMGMLAIFVAMPDEYLPVLSSAPEYHSLLREHEIKHLGFGHAEVGAALAEKWRMPENIVQSIRFHHDPESVDEQYLPISHTIALGRIPADVLMVSEPAQAIADLRSHGRKWFDHQETDIEQLLERTTTASGELASLLDQNIGELQDPQEILARANEQLVEHQLRAQREAEELERRAAALRTESLTDALTGAANRKRFDDYGRDCVREATEQDKSVAILFIDADHFKAVNDQFGHQAGDAVLAELASRLMRCVGDYGTVCRYGGEEFAIVVPDADLEQAVRFAGGVQNAITSSPFDLSDVPGAPDQLAVTVSLGVSAIKGIARQSRCSIEHLVGEADQAVYRAKQDGRNCVRIFKPAEHTDHAQATSNTAPAATTPTDARTPTRCVIIDPGPLTAGFLQRAFLSAGAAQVMIVGTLCEAAAQVDAWRQAHDAGAGLVIAEWKLKDGCAGSLLQQIDSSASGGLWRLIVLADDPKQKSEASGLLRDLGAAYCKRDIARDLAGWVDQLWIDFNRRIDVSQAA